MKLKISKNWLAKLMSLLLAAGIWFLIKGHLAKTVVEGPVLQKPPRALPVDEETLEPKRR